MPLTHVQLEYLRQYLIFHSLFITQSPNGNLRCQNEVRDEVKWETEWLSAGACLSNWAKMFMICLFKSTDRLQILQQWLELALQCRQCEANIEGQNNSWQHFFFYFHNMLYEKQTLKRRGTQSPSCHTFFKRDLEPIVSKLNLASFLDAGL